MRLPSFASNRGRHRIIICLLLVAPLFAWNPSARADSGRPAEATPARSNREAIDSGGGPGSELVLTGLRKGPYLFYPDDPTKMQVLWQTFDTGTCALEWGRDTQYMDGAVLTSEYGDDHQHTYEISRLVPATRYFYRVTVGEMSYAASFVTAPSADATSVKFMVHGDSQANIADHDLVCEAMIRTYEDDPDFQSLILGVGDISNFGMVEHDWSQYFFNPAYQNVRERLAHVPFHTAIGNHELYETATTYDLEAPIFRKYFPYPFVDDRYWSFDYGPAHIIIADLYPWYYDPGLPNIIPPGFISPEQAEWIQDDLAASERPWKIVVIHEPGWSAGPHPNNPSVQDTLHPLCEIHGIDLVLAGHNHYYARADVDGIQYITTSGGAHLYGPTPGSPYVVTSRRDHHFLKIEINGPVLGFTAVKPDGEIIDQFTIDQSISVRAGLEPSLVPRLHQNSPNPFRPRTSIRFELSEFSPVSLRIYNVGGRLVRTLVNEELIPDSYSVEWDGRDDSGRRLASGTYWYRLTTPGHTSTRTLVISR